MNKQGAWLHALGGHAVDLWRLATFNPSVPHSLSKLRQLRAVARRTNASTFIETGTYLGNTTMRASRSFERVITIEIDEALFNKAQKYLSARGNVECILGDCVQQLPKVMQRKDISNCLIFLDGHFSGGVTGMGEVEEPAIEEISLLANFKDKIAAIVIDDFRMFSGKNGMPSKADLIRSLEVLFHEYRTHVHLDQVLVEKITV